MLGRKNREMRDWMIRRGMWRSVVRVVVDGDAVRREDGWRRSCRRGVDGDRGGGDQRIVGLLGCVELVDGGRVELLVGVPPLRCWSRP